MHEGEADRSDSVPEAIEPHSWHIERVPLLMALVIPSPQQGNVGSMHAPSLQPAGNMFAPFEPSGAQPRRLGRRTRDEDVKEASGRKSQRQLSPFAPASR
jgi:hypothetical protein